MQNSLKIHTMKSINTLSRELDLNGRIAYYEYCIDSYQNGNFDRDLFNSMTKASKKDFLKWANRDIYREAFNWYFELL